MMRVMAQDIQYRICMKSHLGWLLAMTKKRPWSGNAEFTNE